MKAVAKAAFDSSVYSGPSFLVVGSVDCFVSEELSAVVLTSLLEDDELSLVLEELEDVAIVVDAVVVDALLLSLKQLV